MSWSVSAVIPAGSRGVEAAQVLVEAVLEALQQAGEWSQETRHQVREAKYAAAGVAASGALGHAGLLISLGGHANPGHLPSEGFSLDSVHIMLTQQRPGAD